MIHFKTIVKKFEKQGEKTGWTYITITQEQAEKIKPATKVSFRVKGQLDEHRIAKTALLPMGDGSFIMPLNAAMRKLLRKGKGDNMNVQLEADDEPVQHDDDFLECLLDEPAAMQTFQQLARGHQNYFSNWIQSAKTAPTKAKRIALAVNVLAKGMGFPEMIRAQKKQRQDSGL